MTPAGLRKRPLRLSATDRGQVHACAAARCSCRPGRVSLLDLQAALNVDVVFIEEKVTALVKRDSAHFQLVHGELITA